ncbi:MAG: class I SAM-dependent methyltransferase [Pseudomonadota bacterium]
MNQARGIDDPETTLRRSAVLEKKRFLNRLYRSWYEEIAGHIPRRVNGAVLELGSGAGFFKQILPGVITSDILRLPIVDVTLDAQRLPFKTASLKAVVMVDVFHHMPNVALFLSEAQRCLAPGGRIVMIEPWLTAWSGWIYRWLHHEPCLPAARSWALPEGGALSQANSALPWMVFERDALKWKATLPLLEMSHIRLHTPFRYLLSGGMSQPAFLPSGLFEMSCRVESLMRPFMDFWAMFATITLTRRG